MARSWYFVYYLNYRHMFANYIKTTFRSLWNNKTYSFLNIFGLAIGVACAGLIFLWVEDEVNYDGAFAKKERLGQIMTNQTYDGVTRTFRSTPGPLAPALVKELPGIANASRVAGSKPLFALGDNAIYEKGFYTDPAFLDMFSLQFTEGSTQGSLQHVNSVVISEKMARQFFGNASNVIGKNLKVNDKEEFQVTGVFKDQPTNSTLQFEWISPFEVYRKNSDWLQYWGANGVQTYVQLAPGADFEAINKQLAGFIHAKDNRVTTQAIVLAMKDWRLRSEFVGGKQVGGRIAFVRLFGIIAWIILLIACINFMNLATARSEKRAREVGVRKVMGAGKGRLVIQFIGEAIGLSVLSVLLGLAIISLVLPFFNTLVEKELGLGLQNPLHWAALVVIALLCGLVAGSYPSLYLSSFNPIYVFKGLRMKSGGVTAIRKGLVVFQFSVSIVLIICTVLVYQQVQHIRNRQLGYEKNNLLDMRLTGKMKENFSGIRQDLLNTGVVENAALCSTESLYTSDNSSNFSWEGKDPNSSILISRRPISPEYIATMGMQLIEGRDFYTNVKADSANILITETMARLLGKGSALGKTIRQGDEAFQVVGVIKDYLYGDMYGKPDPVIFFSKPDWTSFLYIRYKPTVRDDEALAKIGAVLKKDNPAYPFTYSFVDDQFNDIFKSEALIGSLSRIFAILAIIISCLGLFGLAAYTAERRFKEIGIRKVLGASAARITGLLSRDFLQLVAISCLVAFPVAWWAMNSWLQNYAYHIDINWWVFIIAGCLAIFIALVTVSFQAIKAAIANPIKALRRD
jgi:putative ABC transport system permease protein